LSGANYVQVPPSGLVVALQFWIGDAGRAARLARLIAAIEPRRREDVTFSFCMRASAKTLGPNDQPSLTRARGGELFFAGEMAESMELISQKFDVMAIVVDGRDGHPDGCNDLFVGTLRELRRHAASGAAFRDAFFVEPDGVPLRRDWLDVIIACHGATTDSGYRVTGPLTSHPILHLNGTLVADLEIGDVAPQVMAPVAAGQAWDLVHARTLLSVGRPTQLIKNVYGSRDWTAGVLGPLSRETAWLASVKDESAVEWAEANLVGEAASP
jgi:hypothetical protein